MIFLKRIFLFTIFFLSFFLLLRHLLLLSQETSILYNLDSFQYRVINIYRPQKKGTPEVHIFLNDFNKNSKTRNIEFVQKLQKKHKLDSLFKMKWILRDNENIFEPIDIYKLRFYEKNLKDENSDNKPIGTIGVDLRKKATMCLCFTSCSFVNHDTCFHYNKSNLFSD